MFIGVTKLMYQLKPNHRSFLASWTCTFRLSMWRQHGKNVCYNIIKMTPQLSCDVCACTRAIHDKCSQALVWLCLVCSCLACLGLVLFGMVWFGQIWFCLVLFDSVWYGRVQAQHAAPGLELWDQWIKFQNERKYCVGTLSLDIFFLCS